MNYLSRLAFVSLTFTILLTAVPALAQTSPDRATASGTYTYNGTTRILTLNTTASTFECEGLAVGRSTYTVNSLTATGMVLTDQSGDRTTWTRASGSAGSVAGTWSMADSNGQTWTLVLTAGRFTLSGPDDCSGGGNGGGSSSAHPSMTTPYANRQDMAPLEGLFYWNTHRGLDFHPRGSMKLFQAVLSGTVERVRLFRLDTTGNWQVEVIIRFNSDYSALYAFEPMTTSRADGQTQLAQIVVDQGQSVRSGEALGRLYAPNSNAHVHFSLLRSGPAGDTHICPWDYFTTAARQSVMALIRAANPNAAMCSCNCQ